MGCMFMYSKITNGGSITPTALVRIDRNHRAIFRVVDSVNLWYWVGTHKDYDIFTGIRAVYDRVAHKSWCRRRVPGTPLS